MMQNRRYEVRGSMALAYSDQQDENLIDYDIARRSFEARQRLALRQQRAAREAMTRTRPHHDHQEIASRKRPTLEETMASSYTPGRTMSGAANELLTQLGTAISSHPFVYQLRYGSLRGEESGRMSYRHVVRGTTVYVAISAFMLFIGA